MGFLLQRVFKWLFLGGLVVMGLTYFSKDALPEPEYYDPAYLENPAQRPTSLRPFETSVNGEQYRIQPKFDYELHGVVVSYHDADALGDIWHHDRWKDFLNVRDLCVIWGDNVRSGVYRQMDFDNDSWTCWAYWPDRATASRFSMTQLSNNHLLTDDPEVKRALMAAEPGDHIRFKGVLATYANPGNGFERGTSISRTDTGNGACETVYLQDFDIVNKANANLRAAYRFAKWVVILSMFGSLVMVFAGPVKGLR